MAQKRQTLLIDFDGVLHDYHGWTGPDPVGIPIEKARHAMHHLASTYRLVCFTTRPAEQTRRWLLRYGFPEMKVTNMKEPAFLIIDDRAITFPGTWTDELLSRITSFSPHWSADAPVQHATHPDKQHPSAAEQSEAGVAAQSPPASNASGSSQPQPAPPSRSDPLQRA